ncbi:hypothetical protein KAU93_02070, partial [Candidatus Bathyarchaeota archaeon]|nr:hypothetical protein [Candidatus Bathyarchaeota archaeon]
MAQRHIDEFYHAKGKPPPKEREVEALPFMEATKKERKQCAFPPVAPENLPPSYFVSATYDGKTRKALIKLYEPTS